MNFYKEKLSFLQYIPFYYYLLVFLTPLLMNSVTSEIFEFNKMIFIYFITLVVSFLYVIRLIVKKEPRITSFFTILLIVFFISQLLSTIYSIDVLTSVFGYYGRWNGGLLSIFCYILLFFICIQTFAKKQVHTLLKVSLISSSIVIIWGLLATAGYDFSCYIFTGSLTNGCWTAQFNPVERMFSTIGQPNWLGAYLAFHFFIGIYFLLSQHSFKEALQHTNSFSQIKGIIKSLKQNKKVLIWSVIYSIYLILNITAIYLTKSRSTLLAVLISVGLGILIIIGKNFRFKKRTEEIVILTFALGVFITFFVGWKSGFVKDFFALPTQTSTITDSFDIRKVVWKGAIDLGFKYPYTGAGLETFAYSYYFTRPDAHNLTSEWDFIYNKAHNEYLNYFATTGFIGVSSYLLLIIGVFILSWRYYEANEEKLKVEKDTLLVTSLLLGYITILITNFFGFSVSSIQILFYLTPALIISLIQKEKEFKVITFKHINVVQKSIITLVTILSFGGLWYLLNYYSADMDYAKAKIKMNTNDYGEALVLLDSARRKKYEHVYEDKMSYSLANLAFVYSFSDEKERVNKYIMLADIANLNTLKQAPDNIQYWRTRGKNYYLFYQINGNEQDLQKALISFEKVISLAPTDVQSRYTLSLFQWIASREIKDPAKSSLLYGKGLDSIKKVLDMRPNYVEAQELLGEMIAGV